MQEPLILAQKKGFELRYSIQLKVSNRSAYNHKVNDNLEYLILCEIQKWLREVHNIIVEVVTYYDETDLPLNKPIKPKGYFAWDYYNENFSEEKAPKFKTYEQALEHGLQEALKLIPDENNR